VLFTHSVVVKIFSRKSYISFKYSTAKWSGGLTLVIRNTWTSVWYDIYFKCEKLIQLKSDEGEDFKRKRFIIMSCSHKNLKWLFFSFFQLDSFSSYLFFVVLGKSKFCTPVFFCVLWKKTSKSFYWHTFL